MADLNQEVKVDESKNFNTVGNNSDPRNIQELTQYVQTLLQQTQDKFQTMSEQIISRIFGLTIGAGLYKKRNIRLNKSKDKFVNQPDRTVRSAPDLQIYDPKRRNTAFFIDKVDEMGTRVDDLEKNISDLMTQAGVEGPEK